MCSVLTKTLRVSFRQVTERIKIPPPLLGDLFEWPVGGDIFGPPPRRPRHLPATI